MHDYKDSPHGKCLLHLKESLPLIGRSYRLWHSAGACAQETEPRGTPLSTGMLQINIVALQGRQRVTLYTARPSVRTKSFMAVKYSRFQAAPDCPQSLIAFSSTFTKSKLGEIILALNKWQPCQDKWKLQIKCGKLSVSLHQQTTSSWLLEVTKL